MYQDKTLICKECGQEFVFTAGEQEFYAERGFMKDVIHICNGFTAGVEIADVTFEQTECGIAEERSQVLPFPRDEIVKTHHLIVHLKQSLNEVGADESCSSRNQNLCLFEFRFHITACRPRVLWEEIP